MRVRGHTPAVKQVVLNIALLLLCPLLSFAAPPCGDPICINGNSASWNETNQAYQFSDPTFGGTTYMEYKGLGVDGFCTSSEYGLRTHNSISGGTSDYCGSGSTWRVGRSGYVLTDFLLAGCSFSYGSACAASSPTPTPTPTATPEASPTPQHVIVDNMTEFQDLFKQSNQVLFCLVGMLFVAIASSQMRL